MHYTQDRSVRAGRSFFLINYPSRYPIKLGVGKRLFADSMILAAFKVAESQVSPNGIIVVLYEPASTITTGSW
jgi:hypothetical protein